MCKEIKTFCDIEVEKHKYHQHKSPISIYDVKNDKIVVPNRVPFDKKGFKYFVVYEDGRKVKPLCVMLPKISANSRDFDETKYMSFLIRKNNEIWDKVSKVIKKRLDSDLVYNDKYLKTKIRSYEEKINTNFHDDKVPKECSQYICLSVILIDSVFRTGKNYYPQVFL